MPATSLLSFSSSGGGSGGSSAGEAGGGTWRNVVLALSLPEGDVRELAPPRGSEAAPLVGLRLSPSGARFDMGSSPLHVSRVI